MGGHQDRPPGGLVDAVRFHAHQAAFDHIGAADAVRPAQGVQVRHQGRRGGLLAVDRHRRAGLKGDLHDFGLVGGVLRGGAQQEHALGRLLPGILQRPALVGQVPQVAVTTVDRFYGGSHRDVALAGVMDGVLARADLPLAPGGDHLEAWVQGGIGQLEAHLVVALAGGPVGYCVGAHFVSHFHLVLGDQRARHRSAQQVLALVNRPGAQHRI